MTTKYTTLQLQTNVLLHSQQERRHPHANHRYDVEGPHAARFLQKVAGDCSLESLRYSSYREMLHLQLSVALADGRYHQRICMQAYRTGTAMLDAGLALHNGMIKVKPQLPAVQSGGFGVPSFP